MPDMGFSRALRWAFGGSGVRGPQRLARSRDRVGDLTISRSNSQTHRSPIDPPSWFPTMSRSTPVHDAPLSRREFEAMALSEGDAVVNDLDQARIFVEDYAI